MGGLDSRRKLATQRAEGILKERGITALPVDPIGFAESLGIMVQAKPETATGSSGMLLKQGDQFAICYATHIASIGFQHFSVAHELGHYFLPGHVDLLFRTSAMHTSQAGKYGADPYEQEADSFAAGLLMPSTLVKRELLRCEPGMEAIRHLSERCNTSLTATAIRYATCCDEAVAVFVSEGPRLHYAFLSDRLKYLPGLTWPRRNEPLPPGSGTIKFNRSPEAVSNADQYTTLTSLADWLSGAPDVEVEEQVVGLGDYGRTLTVLYVDEDSLEDDDS